MRYPRGRSAVSSHWPAEETTKTHFFHVPTCHRALRIALETIASVLGVALLPPRRRPPPIPTLAPTRQSHLPPSAGHPTVAERTICKGESGREFGGNSGGIRLRFGEFALATVCGTPLFTVRELLEGGTEYPLYNIRKGTSHFERTARSLSHSGLLALPTDALRSLELYLAYAL